MQVQSNDFMAHFTGYLDMDLFLEATFHYNILGFLADEQQSAPPHTVDCQLLAHRQDLQLNLPQAVGKMGGIQTVLKILCCSFLATTIVCVNVRFLKQKVANNGCSILHGYSHCHCSRPRWKQSPSPWTSSISTAHDSLSKAGNYSHDNDGDPQ